MTTSSFITLTDGDRVRFDFEPPPAPAGTTSLGFQLLDPSDQPIGPEVSVFTQTMGGVDNFEQVDSFNAAALSRGGFVLAYEDRFLGLSPRETLRVVVVDAHGAIQNTLSLSSGDVPTGAAAAPGVFGLSGDGFALVYERLDGQTVSEHLAVGTAQGLTDLLLPSAPTSLSDADGVLTLGFADGSQALAGGAGADSLAAGSHGDLIRGGGGNDSIQGGAGADNVNGNQGDDVIDGGSGGADFLLGGQGNDLITAHAGNDVLYGNLGDDTLNGGSGDEILRGGQGNDALNGGAGNDWLSGDRGSDTITGGAGADIFHSFSGAATDIVTDFNAAEGDRVQLDLGTTYTVAQSGADVVIDINVADAVSAEVILKNVQLSSLPADFIFLA